MTARLRIGVIGGGLISQVEHIPNLLSLRRQFQLKGVSDPSATVRNGLAARFGVPVVADAAELMELGLDAVVIAAPDPWHGALARTAMEAGLHIFCEKPVCYGAAEIDELAAVQQRAGVVLQIGYMKRFDPSYAAAIKLVSGKRDRLRLVSVEVHDPDAWPFVTHHPLVGATAEELGDIAGETARMRASQAHAALGFVPSEMVLRGFTNVFCSALVHDVNAVHGLLDVMGVESGSVLGATVFAGGSGGQAAVALMGGHALWNLVYIEVPKLADYKERIALYFDDEIVELVFPAPYLNHHPTRLTHRTSAGARLGTVTVRPGFEEAFVRQLEQFWVTVTEGEEPRNTLADARRDQALLVEMAQKSHETEMT
jgi:predicted dehydrogenase